MADALLFPKEILDVLNTQFMGFKLWHILIFVLILPSPVSLLVLLFVVPGLKDKVTEVIKNGVPRVYSELSAVTGEGSQVPPARGA